ncbi:MAG: GTPase HflX [Lachnospiraceae bacterium]|nr:GTPase HflX [Lachnospiraceae bacterium]
MQTFHENKQETECVILVAVDTASGDAYSYDADASLDELAELADTAGAVVVGRLVQKLPHFNPAAYIGSGKIEELRAMIYATKATGIITDDELSPSQMANLSRELDVKVMDRTMVILDIFAAHAKSSEGKMQVELAQLEYRLSRLTGKGTSMSRLGGGIGTRGPGEKKLEQDRRVIRKRVAQLKHEINDITAHREITRKSRENGRVPVFAIVGYTNVGKSTLLNALTGAGILAEDKLFATLDTTTRVFEYKKETGKQKILLTDTVGFIRKLPHNLIDAFRSTLEEARYADYIIHVVDASTHNRVEEMKVAYNTLDELGITGKKIITLFNKIDKITDDDMRIGLFDPRADKYLPISAKTGIGLDELPKVIDEILRQDRVLIEKVFGYDEMSRIAQIKENGEIISEEYLEDGIHLKAYIGGI